MLHELLMSLLGKPGSIIKQIGSQFKVDPCTSILTASEANMINQICQTGYYYAQLIKFIETELTETSFLDIKKNASVYRKAMAQGLRRALQEFERLILAIESDYLHHRHFTFSNIRAQTTRFECIMKEMWQIVLRITSEKYKGGVIIDILWEAFQKGNQWLREWITIVLKECQRVFVSQVMGWIVHGQIIDTEGEFFIHRVVQEPEEKFKFSKRNIEMTGWDIFTLDSELIPLSLVSLETAGKILFIGKSVKILRSSGKISSIPSSNILSDLQSIFQHDYCQIQFESTIEKIRHSIAQEMIKLIIGQQNLLRELQKINDYYLMLKGDFYHHFLEEAKAIENIPQKDRLQKKINENCLQNTFIRLNCMEDAKRVEFQLKQIGFSYIGFKNFLNVCPVGNIDLVEGKYVRFSASGGALWHRSKQIVENSFTVIFSISFKKTRSVFKTRKDDNQKKSNIISFVIQNSKDISPSFHQNPASLAKINQYIAINIGYRYSQAQKNYESFAEVTYRNEKRCSKQVLLQPCPLKKINFLDESVYIVKVAYSNDQIKIAISPIRAVEAAEQTFKVDSIRISNYLNLQMSRANVGFISNIQDFDCQAEIQQWEMICKPINNYGDYWSDLALNLKMSWPINLILTPDLMEIFSRINKFLFPLRQIQIQLEQIWMKIPRRIKEEKERIVNITEARQMEMFQRKLTALRWRMNLVISNLWSYFEADVIQSAWPKLRQSIIASDDLEEVIRMINKYVNTIQTMYYFNAVKIQRCIHEIVRQCRNFVVFFQRLSAEIIDEQTYKEFENISDNFSKNVTDFYKLLKDLSKTSNSTHLFHLTQRMEGCVDHENPYF